MTERRWLTRDNFTAGEQGRLAALLSCELTGVTASRGTTTRADARLSCAMGKAGLRFGFDDLVEDLRKMLGEFAAKIGNVVDASQLERVQGCFGAGGQVLEERLGALHGPGWERLADDCHL